MDIRILGPLEIVEGGRRLDLGRPRQRTVLALLLLDAGRVTSMSRIMEAVYDGEPPNTGRAQIQTCVSALRRLFAEHGHRDVITTQANGYLFTCPGGRLDAHRFTELSEEADRCRDSGNSEQAVRLYREALAMWRGPVLQGIESRLVQSVAARLTEQRIAVNEDCVQLELDLGRHRELVGELSELVGQYPLRERLAGLLMTALYRSGRKGEALSVFQRVRETMIEELGLEPNEELRQLQQTVLTSDESLGSAPVPAALPAALPVATGVVVPRLLPADIADFTGRDQQVDLLRRRLIPGPRALAVPVIVVTGKPGIGKTSIAVHASHTVADDFPDGQLYANLRGTTSRPVHPKQVLERFLRALGVPGSEMPDGTEERAELYRTILSSRRMLIVLDDVGAESQVLPLVPGYPACAVLVTSRGRLAGLPGAYTVEVETFTPEHSLDLLKRIAGRARIEADLDSAGLLARLCGHLPLALRISGARLASRPNWTIGHLVERLEDEARRLDELRYGEMGIRATLKLAYEGTSEAARTLLRRLSLVEIARYADWMAAALLDVPLPEAHNHLDDLVDAQLIEISRDEAGLTRYRVHELTRVFARERAAVEETPARRRQAVERVLSALLTLARQAHRLEYGGDFVQVHSEALRRPIPGCEAATIIGSPMAWFEKERTTLVAAVRQAARNGLVDLCWDLAVTSVTLFEARIYYDDWRHTHEIALDATRRAGNVLGQAAVLCSRGSLHSAEQHFTEAQQDFEAAAGLFRQAGDSHGEALAVRDLAYLDHLCGRFGTAEARYRRALTIFNETGDLASAAFVLHSLARTSSEAGEHERARELLEEGLALCLRSGSRRVEAQIHCRLGDTHLHTGDVPAAMRQYERSLEMVRSMRDPLGESHALRGLGTALLVRRRFTEAARVLAQCVDLAVRARSRLAEVRALIGLSDLGSAQGDRDEAVRYLHDALSLCRKIRAPLYEVRILARLAQAYSTAGELDLATAFADEALVQASDMDPVLIDQIRTGVFG